MRNSKASATIAMCELEKQERPKGCTDLQGVSSPFHAGNKQGYGLQQMRREDGFPTMEKPNKGTRRKTRTGMPPNSWSGHIQSNSNTIFLFSYMR